MSDFDAYEDEMRRLSGPSERDLDQVVEGTTPPDRPELAELAEFARTLREQLSAPAARATAERQIAQIAAAARSAAEAGAAAQSQPAAGARAKLRRPSLGGVLSESRTHGLAKLAGVAATTWLVTAGLAIAGVPLPAPLRGMVEVTGIDVDDGGDEQERERPRPPTDADEYPNDTPGDARAPARRRSAASPKGRRPPSASPSGRPPRGVRPTVRPRGGRSFGDDVTREARPGEPGPPQGIPQAPLEGVPQGPLEGVPQGPPARRPAGPRGGEFAPGGPPSGRPGARPRGAEGAQPLVPLHR